MRYFPPFFLFSSFFTLKYHFNLLVGKMGAIWRHDLKDWRNISCHVYLKLYTIYVYLYTYIHIYVPIIKEDTPLGWQWSPQESYTNKNPSTRSPFKGLVKSSSDFQNNVDYHCFLWLPLRSWEWGPIAQTTTHLGEWTLVTSAGSDMKTWSSFHGSSKY